MVITAPCWPALVPPPPAACRLAHAAASSQLAVDPVGPFSAVSTNARVAAAAAAKPWTADCSRRVRI